MRHAVLCFGVLAMLPALPAQAATLRATATIAQGQVRVGDLFEDAGSAAQRVLGPGPAPGSRIVVEAPQLAAIARQFGVAWKPATPSDRIVIDRPGRLVPREAVMASLHAALVGVGAPEDGDIEVPGLQAPVVAMDTTPQLAIEQVDYEAATGRFTATLAVAAGDMPVERARLSGRVVPMLELAVATRKLSPGTVIAPGDLRLDRVHVPASAGDLVRDPAQAIGMAVKHAVAQGQAVAVAELARPLAVQKGDRVTMLLQVPGLSLSGIGQALGGAAVGDRVSVLNPASRSVVEAVVTAPGTVLVAPGAEPRPLRLAGAALPVGVP